MKVSLDGTDEVMKIHVVDVEGPALMGREWYRNTPHSETNETPAMLLKRGQLRTKLDLMKPDVRKRVEGYQEKQVGRNKERRMRTFDIGNRVIVRDYRCGKKWKQGVVVTKHPYSILFRNTNS